MTDQKGDQKAPAKPEEPVEKLPEFPQLTNDLLLRAARGERCERTPVWFHRQAGRYLPEFRELRKQHDFFTLAENPELICKVTLQPVERFEKLDAAIIFSDILVIPKALGLTVKMEEGVGPVLPEPLQGPDDLKRLKPYDPKVVLKHVLEGITLTRNALKGRVPLIGFCGAPWTLMCYMVHGGGAGSGKSFDKARAWLYKYPQASEELLDLLTTSCIEFLIQQALAGAQYLEVFDSWAGDLTYEAWREFSFKRLKRIASEVGKGLKKYKLDVPIAIFAKGAHYALEDLRKTEYRVIAVDWTLDPQETRDRLQVFHRRRREEDAPTRKAVQGNLDPAILYAPKEVIEAQVGKLLRGFTSRAGYIFNLGHGMLPDHSVEAVGWLLDAVHTQSIAIRSGREQKKAQRAAKAKEAEEQKGEKKEGEPKGEADQQKTEQPAEGEQKEEDKEKKGGRRGGGRRGGGGGRRERREGGGGEGGAGEGGRRRRADGGRRRERRYEGGEGGGSSGEGGGGGRRRHRGRRGERWEEKTKEERDKERAKNRENRQAEKETRQAERLKRKEERRRTKWRKKPETGAPAAETSISDKPAEKSTSS